MGRPFGAKLIVAAGDETSSDVDCKVGRRGPLFIRTNDSLAFRMMANNSIRILVLVALSWVCLAVYFLLPQEKFEPYLSFSSHSNESAIPPASSLSLKPAALHLIVPASNPDPNLCKVLLSAGVLGYPSPVIVNWNHTFADDRYVEGGSHLAKLSGVETYLSSLEDAQDEDLVLMVDGYDVWLQLRPQTLVSRFYDINRKADARLAKELGPAQTTWNIHQEVVFGVQKRCWPWTFDDPPCYAAPESTLPADIYGPDTDTDIGSEPNPYIKFRPRYTNSGVVMGTVRGMRKMFRQAVMRLESTEGEKNMGSDQYVLAHIIGDQNVWREAVRRDEEAKVEGSKIGRGLSGLLDGWRKKPPKEAIQYNEDHIRQVREKAALEPDGTLEFGVGYDYWSELGLATVFQEDETEWLVWSNSTQVSGVEATYGLPLKKSRLRKFPEDVSHTPPPFHTFNDEPLLPRNTSWDQVPLFTNAYTGVVPAVIHHNAHRDGRKKLREEWWDKLWMQPYARVLYDASIWEPIMPVAYAGGEGGEGSANVRKEYWPAERWKGGARTSPSSANGTQVKTEWLRFDDVCKAYHEEVFRDGKGPWTLPEAH
ncbi:unnamed protein product [Zymoseptoria tritici ST99CH_1A5]|uniref:Uncharacterized protein n=1 Tax=Zymoseptoria tritici ST99CH_1A5 TaxID=1276529 RepID=A0A1Y6LXZ9_ZYMTR|nr:unnamed protein product [Zymoseptoria tritici ST99CH_1A5]